MIPTWAAVVGALSLAVIALSVMASAAAVVAAALGMRAFLRATREAAEPVVHDLRQLVGTIRTEADGLAETSRDLRQRIVRAADATEGVVRDVAATVRTVSRGVSLLRPARPTKQRPVKRRRG
jgi:signal transduction histidine kinase